ncbi:hypothetical protein QCA50_000502 [Cerrena zonata]|uniref:Uncharacterized protein n=1 Tax=Cerrena zonata TaxID=2478898 RepID=A0AAW0GV02_9APHY
MQVQQGAPNPATTAFQLSIPRVLQHATPALASLHASRFRVLHYPDASSEALSDSHCTKCGAFLHDGTANIRTVRSKQRKRKGGASGGGTLRVLRKSCGTCGHFRDIPLGMSNVQCAVKEHRKSRDTPTSSSIHTTPVIPELEPQKELAQPTIEVPPLIPAKSLPSLVPVAPKSESRAGTPVTDSARSKAQKKKKGGLQEMLARNRERQEQEKKKQASSGLSAFLEGL